MRILVLGGCHTYAFGLNEINNGFLQKFLANLKTINNENIELTHFAPITIKVVNELIDSHQIILEEYDLVILQLGNYEFETKISESYKLFKVGSKKNNTLNKPVFFKPLNDTIAAERRGWYKEGFIYDPLVETAKNILSPLLIPIIKLYDYLFGVPKLLQEKKRMEEMFIKLSSSSDKVICLSPFPQFFSLPNFLRKYGSIEIGKFCQLYNIKYINLHQYKEFQKKQYLLVDQVHLNENGHLYLFHLMEEFYLKA